MSITSEPDERRDRSYAFQTKPPTNVCSYARTYCKTLYFGYPKSWRLSMQNYYGPFYFGELNHTIRNTVVISSYFGLQLIFAPFNFAVQFGSRNSRNKGRANIKGFTVPFFCSRYVELEPVTLT